MTSTRTFLKSPYRSREVNIGGVPLGGNNPIRIQSMTNTPTLDTEATVKQCIKIIKAGGDYVRITIPTSAEADNLINIKTALRKQGFNTPLIADIHFNPELAEKAARVVEKVRINPGNFGIRRNIIGELSENEYQEELEKIHIRLRRLIDVCRQYGTVIRIGVNHGSLSPRILSRYGDTPAGMVESAMEFVRICAKENFHNIVISLKASNTRVMVHAYRLLVDTMLKEGFSYPLHLGVTEAGDGIEGRIRSAVGIASLLADGIGDTIRVSLTENPEYEIPVAQKIVKLFSNKNAPQNLDFYTIINPFEHHPKDSFSTSVEEIGGKHHPIVIADLIPNDLSSERNIHLPDFFYLKDKNFLSYLHPLQKYLINLHDWFKYAREFSQVYPLYTASEYEFYEPKHPVANFVIFSSEEARLSLLDTIKKHEKITILILETFTSDINDQRELIATIKKHRIQSPIIINRNYALNEKEELAIISASQTGIFHIDNVSDGIWLRNAGDINLKQILDISFNILQATRVRTTKTEYISCPSCGRTLFDLQSVTAKIKEKTSHLKHLKIAIMGCIVNGPGEMADADYGYVGAGTDRVTLYKGKQVVKKNIPAKNAVEELISLIKENDDWIDP